MRKKVVLLVSILVTSTLLGCGKEEMNVPSSNSEVTTIASNDSEVDVDSESDDAEDVVYPTTMHEVYQLPDDYVIHWRDEALERWIRKRVVTDKEEDYQITLGDVRDIETLNIGVMDIGKEEIKCFDDLIYFESVKNLSIMVLEQPSVSLEVLKELTKLESVTFFSCSIESGYEILKDLENVTSLELKGVGKFDFQNIAECTELTKLTIDASNMTQEDTQYLLELKNLKYLTFFDSDIQNFEFLSDFENLTSLKVSGNKVVPDLKSFENVNCMELYLTNCGIIDIEDFRIDENVELLHLNMNDIKDVSVLSNYINLNSIDLSDNPNLDSVETLSNLPELWSLDIRNTSVADVSFKDNVASLYQ